MTASFDDKADRYGELVQSSISFAGQEREYFTRRKADGLTAVTRRLLGDPADLVALDVGAGVGETDSLLAGRFGRLISCDPSSAAVGRATERNQGVPYVVAAGTRLPFSAGAVDLAFAVNVLHHVDPLDRPAFLAELTRVVRPGGAVVAFEHNPWNPLTRLSVARCEFDEGVELLSARELRSGLAQAGLDIVERRYVIFTPFDSAWQHRLEDRIGRLALGAQHYVAARRPA